MFRRLVLTALLVAGVCLAQSPSFDVASVKPNKSDARPNSNFPLGPGDAYTPNGGFFNATGLPLATYIFFAYKLIGAQATNMLEQLPEWTRTERFDIQARAEGNPGKDEMRLMIRALLADRFKLAVHHETRDIPVLALTLVKSDKFGPRIRLHSTDTPCSTDLPPGAPAAAGEGGFPVLCSGLVGLPPSASGRIQIGASNVTIKFLAESLSQNTVRPMIDRTGISGTVDFTLEWTPELRTLPPGSNFQPDPSGASFEQALREQLGLKLESTKAPTDVILLDHVEHPSEN